MKRGRDKKLKNMQTYFMIGLPNYGLLRVFRKLTTLEVDQMVYGISFPWTYVDRGISPEDLSPELKDPYL